MARHYTSTSFFRHMPNALLARYFERQGELRHVNFAALSETKVEPLHQAWLALPPERRNPMEADFREIHELCDEGGFVAIRDEAEWQLRETPGALEQLITSLAVLPGHCERAMVTFLDHPQLWRGACRFHHADRLNYWRKRKHLGHRPAAVDKSSVDHFAAAIGLYFHHAEGRGRNCIVEPLRRGERDYFFAYPEDHSQRSLDWEDGDFTTRPRNPAFEVVFVYSQAEGSLDLNFRGIPKTIEALQNIFAQHVLKVDELPPDPKDTRVYDLEPLRSRQFEFTFPPASGIQRVAVKELRLSSRARGGDRVTFEANTTRNPLAVYDLIDRSGHELRAGPYNVTKVELAVLMEPEDGKRSKTHTVRIAFPNYCSLRYDELDLKLRAMLEASGVEPKEPAETVSATDAAQL